MKALPLAAWGLCALVLAGCEQLNPRPPVDLASPIYALPPVIPVAQTHNGAIFQAAQSLSAFRR